MSKIVTSKREQWLWTLAAIVVVTIYATLGLASTLVGAVSEELLVAAFATCLGLVAVTIVTQGLRVRPGGKEIGIVLGMCTIFVLLSVRMSLVERSHLMEYSILAILVYEALLERVDQGRHVRFPAFWAALITSTAGIIDEGIQLVLPSRVFDWEDIVFNLLAAVVTVAAMSALRWVRR